MHYYQFNIADYRKDTVHLTRIEHGIYRDLIDWYYLEETPIPTETQSVMRRLRLGCEMEAMALKNVLQDFFSQESDGFHHKRIDFDIAEYHAQCDKNRSNGLKGGRPKGKKTQSVTSRLPVATQTDATANPNHKPLTINHKPSNTPSSDGFELVYQAYPKKVGKPAALKAWKAAKVQPDDLPVILGDIATRSQSRDWLKEEGQFIPNPATYLNQRRWEDQPQQAQGSSFAGGI